MTEIKSSRKKIGNKNETDIFSLINECASKEDITEWSGILEEYLPMVIDEPYLNDLSHSRIWRMVESMGVEFESEDEKKNNPHYKFYEEDLFGVDHVLAKIMEYFRAAAAGSEVSRRILLLWGPTSSGKSQFAILLKKGLEAFSRTKEGRIFAIDGCPMFENPLNAIPESARKMLKEKHNIVIEGELCPKCAYRLQEEFKGNFWKFPVKRIFLSEMNRIGIGTFQPGDTKCVKGDSLVLTNKGLITIEDLEQFVGEDGKLSEIYCIDENGNYNKATNFFKYKNKEVLNIKTSLNYNISATPNHPLMTLNKDGLFEWKEAGFLKVGDSLVLGQGKPQFTFIELKRNLLNLKWTNELAWILGVFIAEGSYRRNTVEIANCNDLLKDKVEEFAKNIGASVIRKPERITFNSPHFVNFLKENGFRTGAHKKCIPEIVFHSGNYIVEFLRGMWLGDGNLGKHKTKNTNEASYSTVSKLLAQQVHLLLLTLGIPASIYHYPDTGTVGSYTVSLKGKFVHQLQEILKLPNWKITRSLVHNTFNSPNSLRVPNIDSLIKKIYTKTWSGTNWHPYIGKSRFSKNSLNNFIKDAKNNNVNSEYIKRLESINKDNIFYVDINEISTEISDVYDVEVPKTHYFIVNGFISHNSQSQSELVGSVNFAKLELHGVESHPLAYNFDGELNVANRGLMEFIEMLKVDPKFRHILLTLAQEKRIKVERFPLIYADLVPVAHTNECEYNKFVANKAEEALHDRLWVIKFPYNLVLKSEVKIYDKLICHTSGFKDIHIAPHTLLVAGMFAILSRLEEPKDKGVTILQKMQLYNGEDVDGFTKQNVKELQRESEREGLDGISPRYIVNRLAACFAQHGVTTVTPISALRSIEEGLTTNAKLNKEDISKLKNLIAICVEEYSKIACNEVQKAFFVNFEHEIETLLSNYIDNVDAYLEDNKVENEWGDMVDPDERLMRSIEEKVEVTNTGKDSFREEVHRKMMRSKSKSGNYDYQSHPKLKEALQKQLFDERKDVIKLTVSVRNPDEKALKKVNDVIKLLVDQYGYNVESANELLRYVSHIMSKNK